MNEANTLADVIGSANVRADETLEQAHQRLGHTAPRVTLNDINANIVGEYYFTAHDGVAGTQALAAAAAKGLNVESLHLFDAPAHVDPVVVKAHPSLRLLTICVLIAQNGFMVLGTSAPASPDNFNAELGRKLARENAFRQWWPLMGYALREQLQHSQVRVPIYPEVAAPVVVDDQPTGSGENTPEGTLLREFVGYLSASVPELALTEVPRLAEHVPLFLRRNRPS